MLTFGVVVLGVPDRQRAEDFWCAALGYQLHEGPFGGWARVLTLPPGGTGTMIALQISRTPSEDYPRLHFDLHVTGVDEQEAEAERLVSRFCIVDLDHEYASPLVDGASIGWPCRYICGGLFPAACPPSIGTTVPGTNDDFSEHSQSTTPAPPP